MVFSCSQGTPLSFRYSSGGAKAFIPGDPTFPAATGMCSVLICLGPTHKSSRPSIEGFIYDCAACCSKKGLLALLAEVFSTENPRLLCFGLLTSSGQVHDLFYGNDTHGGFLPELYCMY